MMRYLLNILLLLSFNLYAKDDLKIYTQQEFDQKLDERIEKVIERLKKKSITQLTKDILKKEQDILDKEIMLVDKEEQLKIAEETLSKRILEFEKDKKRILGCVDENESKAAMRVTQLVEMISGMKPLKAAELLSVQDSEISVKIIERIEPVKASKIFNVMDKEVSARLQKQYLNMKQ